MAAFEEFGNMVLGAAGVPHPKRGPIIGLAKRIYGTAARFRNNRKAKGKRIAFAPRSYAGGGWSNRRRPRAGTLRAPARRRPSGQFTKGAGSVPVRVTSQVTSAQPVPKAIVRTDINTIQIVKGATADAIDAQFIFATNTELFPAGSAFASQFQYATLDWIRVDYVPTQGSEIAGQLVVAAVANPEQVGNISSITQISGQQETFVVSLTRDATRIFSKDSFDQQFRTRKIISSTEIDPADSQYVQGAIIWGAQGMASSVPEGTILGQLTISYSLTPSVAQTRVDPVDDGVLERFQVTNMHEMYDALVDTHPGFSHLFTNPTFDDVNDSVSFDLATKRTCIIGLQSFGDAAMGKKALLSPGSVDITCTGGVLTKIATAAENNLVLCHIVRGAKRPRITLSTLSGPHSELAFHWWPTSRYHPQTQFTP